MRLPSHQAGRRAPGVRRPADKDTSSSARRVTAAAALLAISATLTACASSTPQIEDRSAFMAEGARDYTGESPERVIQAAQAVLKLSDPKDFYFTNNLNGFTGLRRYSYYAVFAAVSGTEKWEFQTQPMTPPGVRASVGISDASASSGRYGTSIADRPMASIPLYRLFWDRVDYMLGRRPDWVSCEIANAQVERNGQNGVEALSGLCGLTSDGRNAPAPEPFPALAPIAKKLISKGAT